MYHKKLTWKVGSFQGEIGCTRTQESSVMLAVGYMLIWIMVIWMHAYFTIQPGCLISGSLNSQWWDERMTGRGVERDRRRRKKKKRRSAEKHGKGEDVKKSRTRNNRVKSHEIKCKSYIFENIDIFHGIGSNDVFQTDINLRKVKSDKEKYCFSFFELKKIRS